jgi:hypothetical protein
MADEKLNFNPDDLGAFDRAPDPADDLDAFDRASGVTVVPPGCYECRLECGELTVANSGRRAYRLRFVVLSPSEHAGFTLWRYCMLHDTANMNRAKAALAPLGLKSGADLRRNPFPEVGRRIVCKVLVGVQRDDPSRNEVLRFTVERDERDDGSAAARFALPPTPGEGGQP